MDESDDLALESVLSRSGNIDNFLDVFFNFLSRRTDFFLECPPEGGSFGFPKEYAEKLIISKFKKWKQEAGKTAPKNVQQIQKQTDKKKDDKIESSVNRDKSQVPTASSSSSSSSAPKPSTSAFDSYNGNVTPKYSWTQSITDLDIKVPIGSEIKKGKEVLVEIKSDYLKVSLASNKDTPIFEGKLSYNVVKDESYWNLLPGESINIWLQKAQERWWTSVLEGEVPIDSKSIEAVKPMEDLDEEEQMKIQEIMWNQERKRQGLPTSDEMKIHDVLKQSWDKEDSPFKGQPFDPSIINFST